MLKAGRKPHRGQKQRRSLQLQGPNTIALRSKFSQRILKEQRKICVLSIWFIYSARVKTELQYHSGRREIRHKSPTHTVKNSLSQLDNLSQGRLAGPCSHPSQWSQRSASGQVILACLEQTPQFKNRGRGETQALSQPQLENGGWTLLLDVTSRTQMHRPSMVEVSQSRTTNKK